MRTRIGIALLTLVVLAGCGRADSSTPVACLEGEGAYLKALDAAPGEVQLGDETLISDCLAENQKAGDLAAVGTAMLAATTKLNAEARTEPGGEANLRLGYLLGAAQRGSERTNGIHTDLIRRVSGGHHYSPDNRPLSPVFLRTFRQGFDAGEAGG